LTGTTLYMGLAKPWSKEYEGLLP